MNELALRRETVLLLEQAEYALGKTVEVGRANFGMGYGKDGEAATTFDRAVVEAHTKVSGVLALGRQVIRAARRPA